MKTVKWFARCSDCHREHLTGDYSCPECGYSYDAIDFYYYFDPKKKKNRSIADESSGNITRPNKKKSERLKAQGIKIYPRIFIKSSGDYWYDRSWREIHFCPFCQKEYDFVNDGC